MSLLLQVPCYVVDLEGLRIEVVGANQYLHTPVLSFSPNHFVYNTCVALDDFHHLGRYVLLDIVGHGDAVVAIGIHADSCVDGL